jgi:hypothetical protein
VKKLSRRGNKNLLCHTSSSELTPWGTRSFAYLSITRSSSVMDGVFYVLLGSSISFRDNVFVMDCVMCQVCPIFHLSMKAFHLTIQMILTSI